MFRTIIFASLALAAARTDLTQAPGVLHISVSVADADLRPVPLAGHGILVSDNPPTAAPRRIVTGADGRATITLRPGNYTVESEQPAVRSGRSYQWTEVVDVSSGRDLTLELTVANADIRPATAAAEVTPAPAEAPAVSPLAKWRHSVVAIWTEHRHAGGFLVSSAGLIATSQSALGDATDVEVQLSPTEKVGGHLLVANPSADVAIVRIDPAAVRAVQPVPLACGSSAPTGLSRTQELLTIEVPLLDVKNTTSGAVLESGPQFVKTDFALPASSAGTPVFAGDGPSVGLTSVDENGANGRGDVRVVPASAICAVISSAEQRIATANPPSAAHLPVESTRPLPLAEMRSVASAQGLSFSSYSTSSSEFDILFITPVLLARAETLQEHSGQSIDTLSGLRALADFGEWSEYVSASPPVLFIRATPRLVESIWLKLARGAAATQGSSIPPIKHVGPGFSRMRVLCGAREIVPIHPFRIRTRVSESELVDEGFYAFDPMAIGPQCGTVSVVLSSVKDAARTETHAVDPAVIAQVWKDFAAYREK
jgi:S1-C subfamily serine protease